VIFFLCRLLFTVIGKLQITRGFCGLDPPVLLDLEFILIMQCCGRIT